MLLEAAAPVPDRSSGLLQAVALNKRYGEQQVLEDVSFDVHPGELLGLIGPNGAGKTTLLEATAGLLPIDGGEILWCGDVLSSRRRAAVGSAIRRARA
jgi:ABC-2 type transport system ATP-binding protein